MEYLANYKEIYSKTLGYGYQYNELKMPADIIVDSDELYVTDIGANYVNVFDQDGTLSRQWNNYGVNERFNFLTSIMKLKDCIRYWNGEDNYFR